MPPNNAPASLPVFARVATQALRFVEERRNARDVGVAVEPGAEGAVIAVELAPEAEAVVR